MMLRVSAKINEEDVDIRGVGGDAASAAQGVATNTASALMPKMC